MCGASAASSLSSSCAPASGTRTLTATCPTRGTLPGSRGGARVPLGRRLGAFRTAGRRRGALAAPIGLPSVRWRRASADAAPAAESTAAAPSLSPPAAHSLASGRPSPLQALLLKLLAPSPDARPRSMAQVLLHPFFRDCGTTEAPPLKEDEKSHLFLSHFRATRWGQAPNQPAASRRPARSSLSCLFPPASSLSHPQSPPRAPGAWH